MAIITLKDAFLSFGDNPILNYTNFSIEKGERLCLVGRNGAGKSTLLKVLGGYIKLDSGNINYEKGVRIATLDQSPRVESNSTVKDYLIENNPAMRLLDQYYQISNKINEHSSQNELNKLNSLLTEIDENNYWQIESHINIIMNKLSLQPEQKISDLSGGWLRKVMLAKALIEKPDLLLLDEPTNHLDIEAIKWLEEFILEFDGTLVIISHDRFFINKVVTTIVDLDRGNLTRFPGDYNKYVDSKEEILRVEQEQNDLFDTKLAQEEIWIRQGIKARRTRNEGRVRNLKKLREERKNRIEYQGKINLDSNNITVTQRAGKLVFEVSDVSYTINNKDLINNFSDNIINGDKIAIIGKNGIGKTTLVKLLLGKLSPTKGIINKGTKLDVVYFDQHRLDLDFNKTVIDNISNGRLYLDINGSQKHAIGYLQDFLFTPTKAMSLVKTLSGGEINRLLLAKSLLKPHNILILDEPTNDLDIETIELLEELLINYKGTVIIISHDRNFIDNVATSCYIFEDNGIIDKYVGGYSDAMEQRNNIIKNKQINLKINNTSSNTKDNTIDTKIVKSKNKTVKLSYKESKELEDLPLLMEQVEKDIANIQSEIISKRLFNQPQEYINKQLKELSNLENKMEKLFNRWEELENKS